MLNELWLVYKALEKAGIQLALPHPLINQLPISEKNIVRVRLNKSGNVSSIEDISDTEKTGIRRIFKTSDGSFPVLKVNMPLLDIPQDASIWNDLGKRNSNRPDLLKKVIKNSIKRNWFDAGSKWDNSLDKAVRIIEIFEMNKETVDLVEIAKRFKTALQSDKAFIDEICSNVINRIETGRFNSIDTAQVLLVGKGKDNEGKDKKISTLLVLEIDKGNSIYSNIIWHNVAVYLPTDLSARQREHKHSAVVSAYSVDNNLLEETLPQVKLPILGSKFPLLSMASDDDKAKCNMRYGLTEYTVFPVTSAQSRHMAGALEWLLSREIGTTWRGVASGKFETDPRTGKKKEKRDLLVVFVDEKPEIDAKTANYFGASDDIAWDQFEVDAKAVCDSFDTIVQAHPSSKLNMLLIRKASDGQAQIVLAETPSVKEVLASAVTWKRAVRENVPDITIYLQPGKTFDKKDIAEVKDAKPIAPYPDQIVHILSYQWIRDGASPIGKNGKRQRADQPIIGPSLSDVLNLMLPEKGKKKNTALQMVHLLVHRVGPLLIGVFGAKHAFASRQKEPLNDYPRHSRETALRAVATIAILLDALASRKEQFMKEAPFQVGQVLALADTLHKDYCIVVRDGQMPNTLIGTSLMRRALDNPAGALSELSERMMEYIRWAKVAQTDSSRPQDEKREIAINEARKKLRQYQPLADSLGSVELPQECNDIMKAQMLLGFLATPPSDKQNEEIKEE